MTEEGRYVSAGDTNISTAVYKVCKYYIQKSLKGGGYDKRYITIEGNFMYLFIYIINYKVNVRM